MHFWKRVVAKLSKIKGKIKLREKDSYNIKLKEDEWESVTIRERGTKWRKKVNKRKCESAKNKQREVWVRYWDREKNLLKKERLKITKVTS